MLVRFGLDDGYAVYAEVDRGLRAEGFVPAGRKLGFTNEATWREFDLSTAIWAYVYDRTLEFAGAEPAAVDVGDLVAPRIEPDIVVKVGARPDLHDDSLRCDGGLVDTGVGRNALGGPLNALKFLADALESQIWADELGPGEVITTGTLTGIPYIHAGECWTVEVCGMELAPLSIDIDTGVRQRMKSNALSIIRPVAPAGPCAAPHPVTVLGQTNRETNYRSSECDVHAPGAQRSERGRCLRRFRDSCRTAR